MAAREASSQSQVRGSRERDLSVEGAPNPGKRRCWRTVGRRGSGPSRRSRETGEPEGTTGGVRNQLTGLVEADNADTGCCSGDRVALARAVTVVTAGWCSVKSASPLGVGKAGNGQPTSSWTTCETAGASCVRGSAKKVAASGRVQAPSLRMEWSPGSHDNKLVAEIGERHHVLEGRGASASRLAGSSQSPRLKSLTRRVFVGW